MFVCSQITSKQLNRKSRAFTRNSVARNAYFRLRHFIARNCAIIANREAIKFLWNFYRYMRTTLYCLLRLDTVYKIWRMYVQWTICKLFSIKFSTNNVVEKSKIKCIIFTKYPTQTFLMICNNVPLHYVDQCFWFSKIHMLQSSVHFSPYIYTHENSSRLTFSAINS